ncbi:MAG: HigA family addiction module antidote protein [Deltaproteobacteria bacterium]|nr:HigA family addiction module antidote protein [Deltaproteobacteria bacterium]
MGSIGEAGRVRSPADGLARALGVTPARINEIVRKRRGITGDTALRLARYFETDAQSWLNLQTAYDLRVAELASGDAIERQVKPPRGGLSTTLCAVTGLTHRFRPIA